MSYEEVLRYAEAKCDEWFIENPAHFHDKAKIIIKRRQSWEKELNRLNPKTVLTIHDPKSGIWYPDATKRFPKIKDPTFIDPFTVCVGTYPLNEKITNVMMPSDKNDISMVYHTSILILHDYAAYKGKGYVVITEKIWPKDLVLWAGQFFDTRYTTNDRSVFIEAAIRHVEANLARTEPAEPDSQQSKIGFLSELTPDERRNEQRKR